MNKLPITPLDAWIEKKINRKENQRTREKIADFQLEKLNETIVRARRLSPFYHRLWASCDKKPLSCLADLAAYPLTTAEDIKQSAAQMVCVSQSHINRVVTLNTSGTTGSPKRLYFTHADQELTIDFFRCGISTFTTAADNVMILLPGERPGGVGALLWKAVQCIGAMPISYGSVDKVPAAVEAMCKERASCLVGVPVQVLAMARYWERWGKSAWRPANILLSTDYIPAVLVRELERIWNCSVYGHYGMTEMGLGGGIECAAHDGYHLREADLYFEIIDPVSLCPVPDGEYGEVVFTTLTRQGMPLIRYRTGDISKFIVGNCSCGSKLRRLERIRNRLDSKVCIGNSEITMADLDEAVFCLLGVIDFSAKVSQGDPVVLKVVVTILPNVFLFEEDAVLQMLRKIPAICRAEEDGILFLQVEITRQWSLLSGKRVIGTEAEKENSKHVFE